MSEALPFEAPRKWSRGIPVTGAWLEGHPVGDRRFHSLTAERPFALEGGGVLHEATIAYETWGELNEAADNAVLVCHALTGDAHASGGVSAVHPDGGWWDGVIGPGRAIDTDRWFVVCANVLGGCQGSTGPASTNPETGKPYGMRFPTVTIRDMVRSQARLATGLGIDAWHAVVGGSMGGMQVIEWGLMFADRVKAIAPIATSVAATPWQIGWSATGRHAITLDPQWQSGDYYDGEPGQGPHAGLAIARSVAQITYRSDEVYQNRFQRNLVDPSHVFGHWDRFQVESYLDHHGEKLARRFDANSYLILNRAMDLHDVARGRGTVARAFAMLKAPVLSISITTDTLYHPRLQVDLADFARHAGVETEYQIIDSPHGHDGFLLESDAVGAALGKFLDRAGS
ncbi:MAG TPA: homoserine O-acetyltransferase [Acidimicrobiaceae bacterium]|mgnify:FL=1|nr:homoserine O-acetyltransferase [Acidimicrobiaceae bacterium]